MHELVEYLVQELLGENGDYIVETREGEEANDIVIEVSKHDIGKVIGKQGRIAKAIRTLVKSANAKKNVRYNVIIVEKEENAQ